MKETTCNRQNIVFLYKLLIGWKKRDEFWDFWGNPEPRFKKPKFWNSFSLEQPQTRVKNAVYRRMSMDDVFVPLIEYVVFRKCTPAWRLNEHKLFSCDITYIIKGEAKYTINGVEYAVSAGDLLCLPLGSVREAVTYPDRLMHCFSVNFTLKKVEGDPVSLPLPVLSHIGCKSGLIGFFHELTHLWLDQEPGYKIKTGGVFLLILSQVLEYTIFNTGSSGGDYRIKKITRHIGRHYGEKITVKKMADMAGLDTAYFGQLFKHETGETMHRYLMKTRIRNAENMLRSGEYAHLGAVAEQCGYSDVYHFSKQFKALAGIPPSKYMPKKDEPGIDA
jgi:AraC-like DNA-binding protein